MANTKNIIVGAANFWVGPAGSMAVGAIPTTLTNPGTANTVAVPADPTGTATMTPVGFTQEGVELAYEPDYGEVEVDQMMDAARLFKQGMRVTVNTTLAEATLENLLVVWGQSGAPTGGTINILAGNLGEAPIERSLLFVGPGPVSGAGAAQERVYRIFRAVQTESTSFALRRAEATGLPASFRCLPNAAASGGAAYGTITDRAVSPLLTTVV